jgi:hypothetical protein
VVSGYETAIDVTRPSPKVYVCVTLASVTCPVALIVTDCRTRTATPSSRASNSTGSTRGSIVSNCASQ